MSFKNFDWSVIFPNIALAKINIYEHRTKQSETNESYTFQPLITSLSSFWLHPIFCGSSYCLNFDKFLDKPPLSLFASEAGLTFLIRYKTWALLPCLQSCRRPSRYCQQCRCLLTLFTSFQDISLKLTHYFTYDINSIPWGPRRTRLSSCSRGSWKSLQKQNTSYQINLYCSSRIYNYGKL